MPDQTLPMIKIPSGEEIPLLASGTWGMAEDPWRRDEEITALRAGLDIGLTFPPPSGPRPPETL